MITELYRKFKESGKVSTDTRNTEPGAIFFALKGPNFNANELASQALEKGASFAVIDEVEYLKGDRFILVEDVLLTLHELANHHRRQLDIPFVAITGSNGKTTTKELLKAALGEKYKVSATVGNLNNHIGVPLTLLSIDDSIEIAIVEMGANRLGDIQELCDITEPTHGLITNIGRAHVGYFGGYENIIRAKSEMYHFLILHSGQVWINSQNEILRNMSKRFESPLFYPAQGDFYHCEFLEAAPFVKFKTENGETVQSQLIGTYNFENIAAALCIAKHFEVDPEKANDAIRNYAPSNNRSQIIQRGTNTIIMDAYNANPSSMEAAIGNIADMAAKKKVLILGDMYELGDVSDEEHRKLGELVAGQNFDEVYFCGKFIKPAAETYPQGSYFENKEKLGKELSNKSYENTLILLKGSRSIELETLLENL